MTMTLAAFQPDLGRVTVGEDIASVDPAAASLLVTAPIRRTWCEGRTMIAARSVLAFVPEDERNRLVAEYVDQGGGLATSLQAENAALLEFLAPRLPDPSHALSLCRMDQALTRARSGAETHRVERASIQRSARKRIEHAAWGCIERLVGRQGTPGPRVEPEVRRAAERNVWNLIQPEVRPSVNSSTNCVRESEAWRTPQPIPDVIRPLTEEEEAPEIRASIACPDLSSDDSDFPATAASDLRDTLETQAWACLERAMLGRIDRGPHAALVWFHAEPEAVSLALRGAPPPSITEPAYPLLFAPGLPNLYRQATAEEADLWARLPTSKAAPELIDRLLAEGVISYTGVR